MIAITMNRKKAVGMYQKIWPKTSFLAQFITFLGLFCFFYISSRILFSVIFFSESMVACVLYLLFYFIIIVVLFWLIFAKFLFPYFYLYMSTKNIYHHVRQF
jgi:hypothetical protein